METMKTAPTVLGLIHDFKTQKQLSHFCREHGYGWRALRDSDRNRVIAAILYGKIPESMQPFLPQNFEEEKRSPESSRKKLPDFFLIAGFTDSGLDRFLEEYRSAGLPKEIIKAVVTPVNLFWTVAQTAESVEEERKAMRQEQ